MKNQSGFTLIEMVAVIIILAIMAATALPKFADLQKEARASAMSGVAGGLRSAASMAKSKWLAQASSALDTITMDGTSVSVATGTGAGAGYPTATAAGIWAALTLEPSSRFISAISGDTISIGYSGYETTCYVTYTANSVTAATVDDVQVTATNC